MEGKQGKVMPCKTCLKFPVCKRKEQIYCEDIIRWIRRPVTVHEHPIIEFEKFIGREICAILTTSLLIEFKKEKDNHSCMIVENM